MGCCGCFGVGIIIVLVLGLVYLLAPLNTRVLLLGIDRAPEGTALSRTDTDHSDLDQPAAAHGAHAVDPARFVDQYSRRG